MFRFKPVCLGMLLFPAVLCAQSSAITLLSELRPKLGCAELTKEEKALVVQQAQILLRDLYVHRYGKTEYYKHHEDPAKAIARIAAKVDKMSGREIDESIMKIFNAQRDLHLDYKFPHPQNKYIGFLPMTFTRCAGEDSYFEVRVSAVDKELFSKFAPGQRVPTLGDQVTAYDGEPIHSYIKKNVPIAQGANSFGAFTRGAQHLTWRHFKRKALPAKDSVTITFKAHTPGEERCEYYTVTLPWLAMWDPSIKPTRFAPLSKRNPFEQGVDETQEEYRHFLQEMNLEPTSVFPSLPTAEKQLTWGRIAHANGNFGYLRLNSFVTSLPSEEVVGEVRRILVDELSDTDGLIFDVRANGGGEIALADKLPQLLSKQEAEPMQFRMLNTPLNHKIFNDSPFGLEQARFQALINAVHGTKAIYTGAISFTPTQAANTIGQVYYKPVAVLANAQTYSAGDMFTCGMQDNYAATIFGEDPQTGAGGANVVDHLLFCNSGPKGIFKPLPNGREMRVSWRQTLRVGPKEGELIEDNGCHADVDITPTVEDLITGGAGQLETITAALAEQAEENPAHVRPEGKLAQVFLSNIMPAYTVYAKHTPFVKVYLNGELKQDLGIDAGEQEVPVRFSLSGDQFLNKSQELTFVGEDEDGERLWNLKRQVIVLSEKTTIGKEGFKVDFASAQSPSPFVVINQNGTQPKDGWNLMAPYLQVGGEKNYANFVSTEAVLMMDLKGLSKAEVEFGMSCATEKDFDFFQVIASDGIKNKMLFSTSGLLPMARYNFDMTEFAGQDNIRLHFRFTSDAMANDLGVKISDISVK